MRILIIEDEPGIASFLKEGLEEESYAADVSHSGNEGLEMAMQNEGDYDLLLIDWMIPGISGIEVCRQIRKSGSQVPIIMLTARDSTEDTVFGLEMGANDYIKKPFSFEELLARVRVQLREKQSDHAELRAGELSMNLNTHEVFVGDKLVTLTQKEFALLEFLLRNKGKVCSRTRIIEHVWDIHFDYNTSVIDVYINALRNKLGNKEVSGLIKTIRGVGYILKDYE